MLSLVVARKSETPCEPELLLFAGMNNQLTLFASMNEIQELVAARLKSKTKVVFTSSPGYSSMPPALQLVNAILVLIAQSSGLRMLMAVPNRELEPANLRLLKSERAAAWAEVSRILRGFYEPASILIVLDEVLCQEISNLVTLLKLNQKKKMTVLDWPHDRKPVVPERGAHNFRLYRQTTKERDGRGETAGMNGISLKPGEMKMVISEAKVRKCDGQNEENSTFINEASG